ncbi:MAG TPA: aminoglycoside phosphotransferase family protein [Mycobacteriales bacterium]|nr:aminoglycoside phosphotransferase family protein [Mycobacteriales bacterium]
MPDRIVVPQSYLDQPGWWNGNGKAWLAALPETVDGQLRRWRLQVDGPVMHGSNALVIPVARAGERLVLRLSQPDSRAAEEIAALQFWAGRGTARLLEADPAVSAMVLERIEPGTPASLLPVPECMRVVGAVMRRIAVSPPPQGVPTTGEMVRRRCAQFEGEWERLGRPFPVEVLRAAEATVSDLGTPREDLAVDGDLHAQQILKATREPWLVVDMLLYRGDIEYDLARVLWDRIDDMPTDADVLASLDLLVASAGLDSQRARTWVYFRTVDYWLWGLGHGLTEDPVRCARLIGALAQA